jgi:pyruvate/2-oxoglutarate dehydrogenase complex dihydrolipoamide acyltransferase (E2) component
MATPIKMRRVSKVATTAEVIEWLKSPGDAVHEGEPLMRVLSEKATVDIEAPAAGVLLQVLVPAGQEVQVGTILAWIGQPGEKVDTAAADAPAASRLPSSFVSEPPRSAAPEPAGKVKATPAARRLAAERGVDLAAIVGSGPGGAITPADVERAAEAGGSKGEVESGKPAVGTIQAAPGYRESTEGEPAEPLSGIQHTMLERMTLNVQSVAQATTVAEVDVTEIMRLRSTVPATLTAWVTLAVARALGEYRLLNASLRRDGIVYHPVVHMGVSVETDAGLMVPVIHDADSMTLAQINAELGRLAEAARSKTLRPADVEGATFTVTNSGVLGSVLYTPMIVPPQSAILGMGRAAKTPVVRDDQILVRTLMYLCLSYDHRFIAGGTAVRYLQRVRSYLENPISLVW